MPIDQGDPFAEASRREVLALRPEMAPGAAGPSHIVDVEQVVVVLEGTLGDDHLVAACRDRSSRSCRSGAHPLGGVTALGQGSSFRR